MRFSIITLATAARRKRLPRKMEQHGGVHAAGERDRQTLAVESG